MALRHRKVFFMMICFIGVLPFIYHTMLIQKYQFQAVNTMDIYIRQSRKQIGQTLTYLPKNKTVTKKAHRATFVQVMPNLEVFLYSAVVGNSSTNTSWDSMVLTGWEHKNYTTANLSCCFLYRKSLVTRPVIQKYTWGSLKANLQAKQFVCRNLGRSMSKLPVGVTLAINGTLCPSAKSRSSYLKPIGAFRKPGSSIAICGKIVFGKVKAEELVDWFEIQKLMGVNKVLVYKYRLNPRAAMVLDYYKSEGIADVLLFDFPLQKKYSRSIGDKIYQSWNDEQIPVFDCLERLKGYKFVAIIDLDEYIVPVRNERLQPLFERLLKKRPLAAGFRFLIELFIKSWGKSNSTSPFLVTQYLNRTAPMEDRVKSVFLPDRLMPGGAATHDYVPRAPYRRFLCPVSQSTVHHYRSCRTDWQKKNIHCYNITRYTDNKMVHLMNEIQQRVLQVRRNLSLSKQKREK